MPYPRLRTPSLPPGLRAKVRELDQKASAWFTPVVKWTVYLSVALFLLRVIIPVDDGWVTMFGASPESTIFRARLWQLLTYALLHDRESIAHILFNLLALWFFGIRLESSWGSTRFLRLCVATAAGAALVHIVTTLLFVGVGLMAPEVGLRAYIIGLSGVIYGILTAYALLHPHDMIVFFGLVPMKVRTLIIGLGLLTFIGSLGGSGSVAHLGHLGGILFGWLFVRYPRVFERIPVPRIGHRRWRPPSDARPRWRPTGKGKG